jgi:hypothetical protein
VKNILIISGTVTGLMLLLPVQSHAQQQGRSAGGAPFETVLIFRVADPS